MNSKNKIKQYRSPQNLKEAETDLEMYVKENEEIALQAGGTDLLTGIHIGYKKNPDTIININKLDQQKQLGYSDGKGLTIGSLVTLEELQNSNLVNEKFPILAQAARSVASPIIRQKGTIGGNISQEARCWYYRQNDPGFDCMLKGKTTCFAFTGDSTHHSILGSAKVAEPACTRACPTSVDIAVYMEKIREGEIDEAAQILLQTNPIPSITGRVCPHYCEQVCVRKKDDESVSIRNVERFLGDYVLDNPEKFMIVESKDTGKKVAIIGSGPAGLSAAFTLCKSGNKVTVYDRMEKAGGMLSYGIADFDLPKEIVEKQIKALKILGIEFNCGVNVGKDITLDKLAQMFDAVLISTGTWKEKPSGIKGEELCLSGVEFISKVNSGKNDTQKGKVLIVGSGYVAIEAARILKRIGSEPIILFDRSDAEIPGFIAENYQQALEEGVHFEYQTIAKEISGKVGSFTVKCIKKIAGEFGQTQKEKGTEITINAVIVIDAANQLPDLSFLPAELVEKFGQLGKQKNSALLKNNIYAGGDAVNGLSTVVRSISQGRKAALEISERINGVRPNEITKRTVLKTFDINCLNKSEKTVALIRSVDDRKKNAETENYVGILQSEVIKEASRCYNCGCVAACPSDIAPVLVSLDATIVTTKRTMKASEFFIPFPGRLNALLEGELITQIEIKDQKYSKQIYSKLSLRKSIDFPVVSVAAIFNLDSDKKVKESKIVLGAAAPIPVRVEKAEAFLIGKKIDDCVATGAAEIALEGAMPLLKNHYKVHAVKDLVKTAILSAVQA
ncbi:MAG TPA: hypothetical protein DD636_01115 [Anaerolineaceae bacterium]|nr:hypothetical protein [Anaerolineaceae bacterium]